jgi:hypothetical protein
LFFLEATQPGNQADLPSASSLLPPLGCSMRVFDKMMTRDQTIFLLVHGILLICIGFLMLEVSRDYMKCPSGEPAVRIYVPAVGAPLALVAGPCLILTSIWRFTRPFPAAKMKFNMARILVLELFVVLAVASFMPLGGDAHIRLSMGAVAVNLFLLVFVGKATQQGVGD